ncbi:MAG: hypothetical protein AB7U73_24010 [Pirellulales bacterium]
MDGPSGLALAPDDSLWVVNRNSQDISHLNQDGTDLGGFSLGFEPSDVVVDPTDGTLWISELNAQQLRHYSSTGTALGSFTTAVVGSLNGLGISSDGTLHVAGSGSTSILRYSSAGSLVGSLPINNPAVPFRLTVVPVPEPGTFVLAIVGLLSVWLLYGRCQRAGNRAAV